MMIARAIKTRWQLICYKTHFTHVHLLVLLHELHSSFNAQIWNILTFPIHSVAIPSTFDRNIPRYVLWMEKNEYRKKMSRGGRGGHFVNHSFQINLQRSTSLLIAKLILVLQNRVLDPLWSCLISYSPPSLSLSIHQWSCCCSQMAAPTNSY
jgi:hypothetical protein